MAVKKTRFSRRLRSVNQVGMQATRIRGEPTANHSATPPLVGSGINIGAKKCSAKARCLR